MLQLFRQCLDDEDSEAAEGDGAPTDKRENCTKVPAARAAAKARTVRTRKVKRRAAEDEAAFALVKMVEQSRCGGSKTPTVAVSTCAEQPRAHQPLAVSEQQDVPDKIWYQMERRHSSIGIRRKRRHSDGSISLKQVFSVKGSQRMSCWLLRQ